MPPAENSEAGRLLKSQPRDSASYTMADKEEERKAYGAINNDGRRNSLVDAADDEAIIPKGALDPVYEAKARILNRAIQDLGMGRYQWELFVVIGFGWASDNLWPIVTSLILTPVANEFRVSNPPYLTLAQNIGLLAGAMFWGFGCDVFGRKWAFNITLGLTAIWGLISASAPNFAAIGIFDALWSFGVGGNLPVDSAIFLEFLPASHQYLLTILSIDWAIAQVIGTLIAWPLLGNYTCEQDTYLMSKGRDEEAVRVVHTVAKKNGKTSTLSLEDLKACEPEGYVAQTDTSAALKRYLEKVDLSHIKALFVTRKLGLSTGLIMAVWALIGLGYPLYNAFIPYIQATKGADFGDGSTYLTYRNSLIIAVLGVPGALLGGWLVELPRLGRKGTLSLSTILTGVFLYCSTTATTSDALLGWQCAFNFFSNIMYAVLYSFTPELGTGNALCASCNRIFGIMAPIIAIFANLETSAPVYTSGALFIAAGLLVLIMPFESRGKAAL
ncbi:Putative MFS-type transporter PB1E7.08c [Fusarium oxysporum f. sp. cubense race 1]|uniref:Putative MFS-type transporter PB1E7.08c n=1 Tax=Fusarium oxysporum f. sp. cubense (strain race 1) TaxID=1229664 RepID=N4TTY2_FUSC1|nr:Putative MFS-type transporter PB1E7.08c [Fusarium oxysporum f. sp. cubense race 1]